ncbi:MAG: flagellar hook-associated protein FlgL [Methylomonas sp.]
MRISTSWNHQLGVNGMLDRQSKLNETQLKLSSGKKYLTPSENTAAASNLINLDQTIKENQQYQVNIGAARQRLSLEGSGLTNATDILQSIRELAVQGLNDSNNAENKKQIAAQIDELNKQLMGVANTQNANGEYIFSGYKSDQRAFTDTPAYAYQGDANQRSIAIGPARQVTDGDPGEAVFGAVSAGPLTAGSIENIFQAVSKLSADLKGNAPNTGSLADIDKTLVRINTTQASVGARLKALDSQENLNADYILDHQKTASAVGDLDYAEALSKFNLQQTALQAAQQTFVKVQDLSLFKYL